MVPIEHQSFPLPSFRVGIVFIGGVDVKLHNGLDG